MRHLIKIMEDASDLWYHGTEDRFEQFDDKKLNTRMGRRTIGFWFAKDRDAVGYYGPNIITSHLNFGKTLHVTKKMRKLGYGPSWWASYAYENDYDSVIIYDIMDGDTITDVACVFDSSRIKIVDFNEYFDEYK